MTQFLKNHFQKRRKESFFENRSNISISLFKQTKNMHKSTKKIYYIRETHTVKRRQMNKTNFFPRRSFEKNRWRKKVPIRAQITLNTGEKYILLQFNIATGINGKVMEHKSIFSQFWDTKSLFENFIY